MALVGASGKDLMRYVVRLEAEIDMRARGCLEKYGREAYAALSRLSRNAAWIVEHVSADEFLDHAWRHHCSGLPIIQQEVQQAEDAARFESLLAANVESVKELTSKIGHGIMCRECKSNDVAIMMRQTCSADEGMSGSALCRGCGARWTFR